MGNASVTLISIGEFEVEGMCCCVASVDSTIVAAVDMDLHLLVYEKQRQRIAVRSVCRVEGGFAITAMASSGRIVTISTLRGMFCYCFDAEACKLRLVHSVNHGPYAVCTLAYRQKENRSTRRQAMVSCGK